MNWQKLNEVETYTRLWDKFKGLFHKKKHTKDETSAAGSDQENKEQETFEYESDTSVGGDVATDYVSKKTANPAVKQINIVAVFKACRKHWYLYIIWCALAFALACFIILPVPRYYKSSVKLAPEISGMTGGGSLSSLAQQFGVNLSKTNFDNTDAILPDLYPDLIKSVDFQVGLFNINVQTINGDLNTTYYDYLLNHQKTSKLEDEINTIKSKFMSDDTKDFPFPKNEGKDVVNPSRLTKDQYDVCNKIDGNVGCDVDKKTSVISIEVTDQDPLISTTIADSVRAHLQNFITKYRTQKAQNDLNYALKLQDDAKKKYEKARREYAAYSDAHQDVILQEIQSKTEDLENEMQLRYNAYTTLSTQVQAARAKLREQTPAFTTLQSATVPIKPAGPKRMLFCAAFVIMAFVIVTIYSVAYEDHKQGKEKKHVTPQKKDLTQDQVNKEN